MADLNNDNIPDILATDYGNHKTSILINNGSAVFSLPVSYQSGPFPQALSINDFNADGLPDFAVGNYSNNEIYVLYQCNPVGVEEFGKENKTIAVYPNPTGGSITTESVYELGEILIYDLLGKNVMKNFCPQKKSQLDLSSLKPGLYFVKTRNATAKFIKEE